MVVQLGPPGTEQVRQEGGEEEADGDSDRNLDHQQSHSKTVLVYGTVACLSSARNDQAACKEKCRNEQRSTGELVEGDAPAAAMPLGTRYKMPVIPTTKEEERVKRPYTLASTPTVRPPIQDTMSDCERHSVSALCPALT